MKRATESGIERFLSKRAWEYFASLCIALVYVYLANHFRVSVLRQEWWWSLRREDFVSYATDAVSGWTRAGIGAPVTYPNGYLAAPLILMLALALGPSLAQGVYLFAIALACIFGALRFAARDCEAVTRLGIAVFAVFNPWVYTETVAGHFYMVVAYAATMALFGEVLRTGKRELSLAVCFVAIVQQIQFVIVPLGVYAYRFVRRRERLPLAFAAVLLLPACAGIALEYRRVVATPYLVVWETSSSLPPFDALRLVGYFARYGSRILPVVGIVMDIALAIALAGLAVARPRVHRRAAVAFGVLIITATLYSTGTRGPIAPVFEWIVVSIPQSGLFREMYDLLGYTAMAYILLASLAARRFIVARFAFLAIGCVLVGAWFFDPPSSYTVAAADIPRVAIDITEHTRYALFPAFQPLRFGGNGSGVDPDAFSLPGDGTPINDFVPAYPEVAALAEYQLNCDASKLAALGVSAIVTRPWLHGEGRVAEDGIQCHGAPALRDAVPELGISGLPKIGSLVNELGAGNVFFADAPGFAGPPVTEVLSDRRYADPARGWVDARVMFDRYPQVAQAFGGAMTTTPASTLPIHTGLPILAYVSGRLLDQQSKMIAGGKGGYRWIELPSTTTALRCYGLCVVALQGRPLAHIDLNPPRNRVSNLKFQSYTPFLARATVLPGGVSFLRYDVAYSKYWLAFFQGAELQHLRVDASTNGWVLPAHGAASDVVIVNTAAACECFLMALATAFSLVVTWRACLRRRSPRSLIAR